MHAAWPPKITWEAGPPTPIRPYGRTSKPAPYTGPPRYPATPRWGFPPIAWRRLVTPAGGVTPVASVDRTRVAAKSAIGALWVLVATALPLLGAEIWRYTLILLSRDRLLSAQSVFISDTAVLLTGVLATGASVLSVVFVLIWVLRARDAAQEITGLVPYRPRWQVYCALLVPGLNLPLAGIVLTELEHTVNGQPSDQRPRPSGLLTAWWIVWAAGVCVTTWALLLGLRVGAQARADSVVIHALADALAVVLAVLTIRFISRTTTLLCPAESRRRWHYVPRPGPVSTPARPSEPAREVTDPRDPNSERHG